MRLRLHSGFTVSEVLTAIVALIVLGAIAVTLWRTHELRQRRQDGIEALLAVQTAQDVYFGKHARYALATQLAAPPPEAAGLKPRSKRGFYEITIRNSADDLGYWAIARAIPLQDDSPDTRCVELRLDQNGRRFAVDDQGTDRSADCWR